MKHHNVLISLLLSVIIIVTNMVQSSVVKADLEPTIVRPGEWNNWRIFSEGGAPIGKFQIIGGAPSGLGAAYMETPSNADRLILGTPQFAGSRFDTIEYLEYSTYVFAGSPASTAISLQFDIDYDLTDTNTGWQGRLVFEPYFSGSVNYGQWQTWKPLEGKWWASGSPGNTLCPQSNPCYLSALLSAFPNMGIRQTGFVWFKAGGPWAGFKGMVDLFKISLDGSGDFVFDFEPASTLYVDDSWTSVLPYTDPDGDGPAASFGVDSFSTIQAAIDAISPNGTIYIYPGTYNEIAQNRYVLGINGPHQFGLFIADNKDGISLIGVDSNGSPIVDYTQVQATINTNATNNFGYSGIFVEADNVTIQGLRIGPNTPEDNKTIEIIGDGFVLRNSHVAVPEGGSVYINDWRFDNTNKVSHVRSYFIENNWFEFGSSVDIASGAGYSGDIQNRRITGNKFTGNEDVYWALVSFNGFGEVGWYKYPIGGAIVRENDFSGSTQYIRARSNYDNSQFDWKAFWEENTFDKAVVTLSDVDDFVVRSYEYTSGGYNLTNVRRIAGAIQGEINNAVAGDTILAKGGVFTEDVQINKAVTITGQNRPVLDGRFWVNANHVTIQGFEIRNGLASTGVDQSAIYISGAQNVTIRDNHLIGAWTGGATNYIGGRGILTSGNVNNLLVDGNIVEKWVSGLYLNPTTGQITVTNNEIRDNWAGAGTDGQTNVTFRNNYFIGNIEGIGASAVGASFVVEKNAFINNTTAMKHYGGGNPVKAERNWWGHQSGPTITSNPGGSGQPVVGDVDFAPWLCEGTDSQPDVIGFQPAEGAAACTATSEAKRLVFIAYPTGGFEGLPFAVQPVVRAEDNEGNLAVNFNGAVILYLANNPAGGALQGSLLTNAVNGVATFSGVSINKAGENYQLAAIATSLDPAVGGFFNVLPQNADLAVSITATPNPVETGAALIYTVGVQNLGPLPASNLTLTVNLPAGVTFVNAGGTGWTCSQSGGVVTCTRFSLAAASSAPNVTISVNAPNQAGSITATASVNATTLDLVSGNNQASVDTLVVTIPETGGVTIYLPLVKK
jgi:uncharacterized repeat protein (TIGR01451 family)